MQKTYRIFNIDWDIYEDDEALVYLPSHIYIDIDDPAEIKSEGYNILRQKYGFTVNDFEFVEIG